MLEFFQPEILAHKIRVYFAYYVISLKSILSYRLAFFSATLFEFVNPIFYIVLWTSVAHFSAKGQIGDFNEYSIAAYYLLGTLINRISGMAAARNIIQLIRGRSEVPVTYFMLNDLNFVICMTLQFMARVVFVAFTSLILIILATVFYPQIWSDLHLNAFNIISTLITLVLGTIVISIFNSIVGLLQFYVRNANDYRSIIDLLTGFFAGKVLPLSFLPVVFRNITSFLPFSFSFYFPISIILGKKSPFEIYLGMIICTVWIFILFFIQRAMYKHGLNHYDNLT